MAWFRVRLTEEEQRVVNEERCCHPNLRIREKMLVLWLLHTGLTRQHAAKAVGVSRATVQRYVAAFGRGLGRLAAVESQSPGERDGRLSRVDPRLLREATSHDHRRGVRTHLSTDRVAAGPASAQVPQGSGPEVLPGPCDPRAAKKKLGRARCRPSRFSRDQTEAGPRRAQAGQGIVFFVDAAHFVSGPSCVTCGRSRGSSCVRLRDVSGSMSWGRGMR